MSKTVLIVEKDLTLMKAVREGLRGRGFGVEETTDGKGAPELIRQKRPDVVVLAVDLDAGQNGYIICKKLKSDTDLKQVPVIIIGDPKGFESHQKLKTRAEDYVGKPFEAPALVERVGGLVGFPADLGHSPDSLDLSAFADPEEIALDSDPDTGEQAVIDPDFDMVDSMFEDRPAARAGPPVEEHLNGYDDVAEKTVVGLRPDLASLAHGPPLRPRSAPPVQSSPSSIEGGGAEGRELRSRVAELSAALDESSARVQELDDRVRELTHELEARRAELEAARAPGSKPDNRELFALKDAANKKDKEILRLKNELNQKEQEIVELRDRENGLERQAAEASSELARKDAQLRSAQARADQLTQDKKRADQQLAQSREEARAATARLSTLTTDFDALHARSEELEAQLEPLRAAQADAEAARAQVETELSEARGEIDALKSQLDARLGELDDTRAAHDRLQAELDQVRGQMASQARGFADEISGLRQRLVDAEAGLDRHQRRARAQSARLKAQAERLEELRGTLSRALDGLETSPLDVDELDELAEA